MATFQDILNKPLGTQEAPRPIPAGTYIAVIDGQPEITKVGKNNTDCVKFRFKLVQAGNDIDQHALQEALAPDRALQDIRVTHTLWLTDDAQWRLHKFLGDDLGIEKGTSLAQAIPLSMGRQVLAALTHRASDDGAQVFMDVKSTAKV